MAWSSDPFVLREGEQRLYGQAPRHEGFVAIVLAMFRNGRAVLEAASPCPADDEETTCSDQWQLLPNFSAVDRGAIVGEPTLMQAADAQKSVATYVTTVTGHEAHSAKPAPRCQCHLHRRLVCNSIACRASAT